MQILAKPEHGEEKACHRLHEDRQCGEAYRSALNGEVPERVTERGANQRELHQSEPRRSRHGWNRLARNDEACNIADSSAKKTDCDEFQRTDALEHGFAHD